MTKFLLSTAVVLLHASRLAAQDATNPRLELDGLAGALDTAIRRVSLPSVEPLLGADRARGYYVAGFGAMFVVPARSIPRATHLLVLGRGGNPATLGGMPDELPDYAELEAILGAADARRLLDQRRLEEETRREVARTARTRRLQSRDQELRALEARAEQFQREAERLRQEAEHQLEQVLSEVQRRMDLAAQPDGTARSAASPAQPVPEAATAPRAGAVVSAGPGPRAVGAPGASPETLPPPPWRFWFGTDNPEDDRSPARIVSDVREAVTATLETYGPNLRTLGNDELVTVAIDFVPRGLFTTSARAARTLVVRVRKKLLDERAAGRLSSDEFKRRIEINEY